LRRMRAATLRMGQLIGDLLNLARLSRVDLHHQSVDVSATALNILDELQRQQPERKVECFVAPELKCSGDVRLIKVVLDNLLNNAWKFTSKAEHARIEVGGFSTTGEAGYFVKDNGAGFDMTYSSKLFTPFQRLHTAKEFEGTGIGLVTVQRIVGRHGGRAWAEGKVGQGAVVFFTVGREKDDKQTDLAG
jgi:light-regulated signal transduction histidine kinase (bacteriophytochrome)